MLFPILVYSAATRGFGTEIAGSLCHLRLYRRSECCTLICLRLVNVNCGCFECIPNRAFMISVPMNLVFLFMWRSWNATIKRCLICRWDFLMHRPANHNDAFFICLLLAQQWFFWVTQNWVTWGGYYKKTWIAHSHSGHKRHSADQSM